MVSLLAIMKRALLLSVLAVAAASGCSSAPALDPGAPVAGASSALAVDLAAAFADAEREGQGHLGVAVVHVESGERSAYHGTERFPMQSVFKLPLAIEVLARIDAGTLRLDEVLRIRPIDIRPGPSGALADELPASGGEMTVLDLLERALMSSDNTATDVLLERLRSPAPRGTSWWRPSSARPGATTRPAPTLWRGWGRRCSTTMRRDEPGSRPRSSASTCREAHRVEVRQ